MPNIATEKSKTKGHGWPPTTPQKKSGAPFVTVNGEPVLIEGSKFKEHCKPDAGCHVGSVKKGSKFVKIAGTPMAITGSKLTCGDEIKTGGASFISVAK